MAGDYVWGDEPSGKAAHHPVPLSPFKKPEPEVDPIQVARDRDQNLAKAGLAPDTLSGSYFRREPEDEDIVQEGMIVGEMHRSPQGVTYLVEFYAEQRYRDGTTEMHGLGYQLMIELGQMVSEKWKFFDDKAWLMGAYAPDGQPQEASENG